METKLYIKDKEINLAEVVSTDEYANYKFRFSGEEDKCLSASKNLNHPGHCVLASQLSKMLENFKDIESTEICSIEIKEGDFTSVYKDKSYIILYNLFWKWVASSQCSVFKSNSTFQNKFKYIRTAEDLFYYLYTTDLLKQKKYDSKPDDLVSMRQRIKELKSSTHLLLKRYRKLDYKGDCIYNMFTKLETQIDFISEGLEDLIDKTKLSA